MEYITELLQQNPALTAAAAGLVVVVAAWKLVSRPSTPKPKITRQLVIPDADKDTVYLFQLPYNNAGKSISLFGLKVESYLRLRGFPFKCPRGQFLSKAPKGKLPFIQYNDEVISDSSFIIEYLDKKFGSLDADLTPEQRSVSLCVQRLVEEHMYWTILYFAFVPDYGFAATKASSYANMPALLRFFLPHVIRSAIKKSLWYQGIGRYTESEVAQLLCNDLDAMVGILGSKPYFLGTQIHTIDLIVYSGLYSLIELPSPSESPLKGILETRPSLVKFFYKVKAEIEKNPPAEWVD